ncbi:MarR family winged helix-turn-helix transcriptional regulator [Pyxidicoccus trucidator]|uniref:MarR family winged helix-turn-helix transcriptional regulator n=1 Tax=Pyxidicoccus trucidator TaxID=2709662 RepID=UPI001F07A92D|nr:MarR family transcriptional regulator [Pyxidicoccus trucidator]
MGSHIKRGKGAEQGEVREVMDGVRRLVRLLRVSARASERLVGISGAQLFVLQRLAEAGPCSINALAEHTLTHQSSVSVVVARLIERGLVTRRPSPEDGRRVEVALAPVGRALLSESPPMAQARLITGLRRLEPGVREGLARGLSALVAELGLDGDSPPLFFEDEPKPRKRRKEKSDGAA